MTAYAGGTPNGAAIPAGTYVGMEDLNKSTADFNYNDDSFVFTNVSSTVTPEPTSLLLLGNRNRRRGRPVAAKGTRLEPGFKL